MRVKFKGHSGTFECTEPIEQKVLKGGVPVGWAIMFHIYGDTTSTELDTLITPESISELQFTSGESEQTTTVTISGYSTITAAIIKHKENMTVTELQFTKANETKSEETKTEEGVVEDV